MAASLDSAPGTEHAETRPKFLPSHDPLALQGGAVVISKRGRFSQAGRQPIRDGVRENGQPKESGLLFWAIQEGYESTEDQSVLLRLLPKGQLL